MSAWAIFGLGFLAATLLSLTMLAIGKSEARGVAFEKIAKLLRISRVHESKLPGARPRPIGARTRRRKEQQDES